MDYFWWKFLLFSTTTTATPRATAAPTAAAISAAATPTTTPWTAATATASCFIDEATVVRANCKKTGNAGDDVEGGKTVADGEAVDAVVNAYK